MSERKMVNFYAYELKPCFDAKAKYNPESRIFLKNIKIPESLTDSPALMLNYAKHKLKKKSSIVLSEKRLPKFTEIQDNSWMFQSIDKPAFYDF